jgi:hypothetical protein
MHLMAVPTKKIAFWDAAFYSQAESCRTNVSQEPTAPIFRIEESRKKEGKFVRVHGM